MKSYACLILAVSILPQVIRGDLASDLTSQPDLSTLVNLVVEADLLGALAQNEPVTIFAPTNDAFAKVPQDVLNSLLANKDQLKNLLLYHVILGSAIPSTALQMDNVVQTGAGAPLRVNVYNKDQYVIVTANGKRVIQPDVFVGSGSVVHKIDEVLPAIAAGDNIAAVLSKDEDFSTLVAAAGAADLVGALAGDDKSPLTVFAPDNAAFAKLGQAAIDGLLADKPALSATLLRHIASGAYFANGICAQQLDTLNPGEKVGLYKDRYGGVEVKNINSMASAKVTKPDIVATNGVIHRIDNVI